MAKGLVMNKTFSYLLTVCIAILWSFPATSLCNDSSHVYTISTSYKGLLSNPQQTGMLDLLIKEAFHRIGLKAEIVFNPTERSLMDVNAGLADGEINRIEGMEKSFPNLVRVPEPNMTMHFVAFSKRDIPVTGWASLKNLQIGIVKGWKILERNTAGFSGVIRVPSEIELFSMLQRDRIDIALYAKLTGYEQLAKRGITGIRHLSPPLASKEMFLYLHKKNAALAGPMANALRRMKGDGTYQQIVRQATKHLDIQGDG